MSTVDLAAGLASLAAISAANDNRSGVSRTDPAILAHLAKLTEGIKVLADTQTKLIDVIKALADSQPNLVTPKQIADYFQVSTRTVGRMTKSKKWPFTKVGKLIRISLASVLTGRLDAVDRFGRR